MSLKIINKIKEETNNSICVVGIDLSTKTGIVVLHITISEDKKYISHSVIESTEIIIKDYQHNIDRADQIATAIVNIILVRGPTMICLEGYSYASKFSNIMQVEIGAAVRLALWKANRDYLEVAPTSLKKFVTGAGNAKKDMIMKEVYKKWGFEGTDNEADAFGLAMLAPHYYGAINCTKAISQVIDKINKKVVKKKKNSV